MADDIATQLEGAVESLGRFRDSLEDNNIRMGNASSIEAKINKLERDKLGLLEKANKAEGKRMKDLASGMGKAAKSMGNLAMKLGVVGGILTMFKGVVDVLLKVDRHAAVFSKQLGVTRKSAKGLFDEVTKVEGSLQLVGINLGDALKTAGALTQEFGQMSRITGKMVEETAMYAKAFGVGTEQAAQLTEHLHRAGKDMDFIRDGLKKSHIAGNNLGVVFRDLSKNAGMVELYLTRGDDSIINMANRAASLGKSLDSFGKMAEAWRDVESIGENIGKTAQLFGSDFEDGLGDLTELYRMYQNFQDVDLHTKITEQLAKTVKLEDNILKVRVRQQDGSMKWMRMQRAHVEQAAKLYGDDAEFMMRSLRAQKEMEQLQKAQRGTLKGMLGLKEKDDKLTLDSYLAISDAYRETQKAVAEDKRIEIYELEGVQLEAAITLAQKQLKIREEEADVATKVENILKSQAGIWERLLNLVKGLLEPLETVLSKLFNENVMDGLMENVDAWGVSIEKIFSAKSGGAFDTAALNAEIKGEGGITGALDLMGNRLATAFGAQFDITTSSGSTVKSWKDLMWKGWDTLKEWFDGTTDWLAAKFAKIFQMAWENVDLVLPGSQYKMEKDWQAFKDWVSFADEEEISERETLEGKGSKYVELEKQYLALSGRERNSAIGDALLSQMSRADKSRAKGWAGGAHRAIVGEAGTEVGITKSALRELSSAGIPGYQRGRGSTLGLGEREYQYGSRANVASRGRAEADARRASGAYQNELGLFLESQRDRDERFLDDLGKDQRNIWMRDQKEFFVAYPAAVDEAFGRAFRDKGGVTESIYNSVFSGMQAYSRAELAGATKEQAREIMLQGAVAEGLKENGTIDRGLKFLGSQQDDVKYALNGGLEIELEQANKLGDILLTSSENVKKQEKQAKANYELAMKAMQDAEVGKEAETEAARLQALASQKELDRLKAIEKIAGKQYEAQLQIVDKVQKQTEKGDTYNRVSIGLLGGIQQGMSMAAGVLAAGGTRGQAMEMGKRGAIGGFVADLTSSFGAGADKGFLSTMNTFSMLMGSTPMPAGAGRGVSEMLSEAMRRTEATFQSQGRGVGWGGGNAQGRVYNSPHLAMVGEGSQNEVIIPTERIRKGLPINAGVARELGSIGVPGYQEGISFWDKFQVGREFQRGGHRGVGGVGAAGRLGHSYESMGGAAGGLATAGLQFAQTYQQTGDMGAAAGQALGAGIGLGATMAISAIPVVGPFIGPILGPMIGSFIGGKLAGWLGKKPHYKRYRKQALKTLEEHVLTEGMFTFGQPAGIKKNIEKAIGGQDKKMGTEESFAALMSAIGGSRVLSYGFGKGIISPEQLMGLLSGEVKDTRQANEAYRSANMAFYDVPLAKGGIVTRPTSAIIGEKGPEAVIPLGQHGGYATHQQQEDQKNIIGELRKQNQQMGMFIKNIGNAKTVLQVDGRQLAETVGQNMYEINTGM